MSDDTKAPEATEPVAPRADNFITFTEGSIVLPAGYEDRTSNLLVPANPQTQPNLSIARDWMKADETLNQYVDRQLGILKSQLASHKLLGRQRIRLGAPPEKALSAEEVLAAWPPVVPDIFIEGERIDATYKSGKQTLYQRQAAFEVSDLRVLVFTATSQRPLGSEFDAMWDDWLASFVPASSADVGANTTLSPDDAQPTDMPPSGA